MPLTLDIFNDDAFGVASLTAAINNPPEGQYVPNLLDSLFEEEGITTTSVMIERALPGSATNSTPSRSARGRASIRSTSCRLRTGAPGAKGRWSGGI